jgi:hypothetical protein
MKFTLEIEMGNDAMQTGADVIKSIRESLKGEEELEFDRPVSGRLWDKNGNLVGKWEASEGLKAEEKKETRFAPEGPFHMFDHLEGCYWVRESQAAVWAKPQEGKTLADFANSGKAFKRPHHALCYGFIETTGFLKEFDCPEGDGPITLARLTAEDLTATDWEEVK